MKNLCIIPARGGSKRIPRKNIKNFHGKPIIAYSIRAALKSDLFDEVMVSTDDEEIAEVSKDYGAKVPFLRSEKNSGDFATLADVAEEVIDSYRKSGVEFDNSCLILPTAPLVQVENLVDAYNKLISSEFDKISPVVKYNYPIQRALKIDESGSLDFINPSYAKTRSQDLVEAYHDAGQFYWKKHNGSNGNYRSAIVISELLVQDIDTLEDWVLAELKYTLTK
ncbi:pseudaminic acid cytidylyltransferase [Marinoscillum sp.]|uniref:pseudaminic acid cytidylyltransferase n=1 Tax=Marinoscillum sp. TaxID=2024838 RepID=UPI003BAA7EFF